MRWSRWLERTSLQFALSLALFACSGSEQTQGTRIEVVIDADDSLRAQIDRIDVESAQFSLSFFPDGPASAPNSVKLPFSVPVPVAGKATRGLLRVRAYAGKRELVRRTANLKLTQGAPQVWGVYLTRSCVDVFETCDEKDRGTCLACEASCGNAEIDAADLPRLDTLENGLSGWEPPICEQDNELDASMDAGTNNEAGLPDGAEPTPDAGTDAEAGSTSTLTISGPSVAAAPGCIPFTITRADTSAASPLALVDQPRARFFGDASCVQAAPSELSAGQAELSVWVSSTLLTGELTANIELEASSGQASATAPLQLRMRARQVVRGEDLACVLLENDRLDCMGLNSRGRLGRPVTEQSQPLPLAATSIGDTFPRHSLLAGRDYFACGIARESASDTAGPVYCWGGNNFGQLANGSSDSDVPFVPQGLSGDFVSVATGIRHACAINGAAELWCWGDNSERQLADDAAQRKVAARMTVLDGIAGFVVKRVAPGYDFTCASSVAGDLYCWGSGYGASAVKIAIPGLAKVKDIGGASAGTCAITTDDKLYCFSGTNLPTQITGVPEGAVIDELRGSFVTNCARSGNDLYCWGKNPRDWLGTGSSAATLASARRVLLPAGKLESFALAGYDVTALSAVIDGLAYSWGFALGDFGSGSLGIDLGLSDRVRPARANALDFAEQIATNGYMGGCGLSASGAASCWGRSHWIGNGSTSVAEGGFTELPVAIDALNSGTTALEIGTAAVIALKEAKVFSWGYSTLGALGNADPGEGPIASPQQLAFEVSGNALAIGASDYRGCTLLETAVNARRIYCWGNFSQAEPPAELLSKPFLVMTGDATLKDVDVSSDRACVLVGDAVQCWNNKPATPTVFAGLASGVSALEMGARSLCALKANGDVSCAFAGGALATTFTKVASVRAGADHACALEAPSDGGKLLCAGLNGHAQLGNGSVSAGTNGASEVTGLNGQIQAYNAAHENTCARDADGWKCWGSNRENALLLSPSVVTQPTLIAPWQP